ncbi:hypothetical protein ACTXPE_04785 [Psychrobacter celer]|uniref:hypothetical protein n=1 Tax=Psychrobacter celer TaxID=306572 RepID=UPI003FD4AC83
MYLVNYNPNSYQVLGYLDPSLGFHPTDDGTAYFSIDDDIHAQYSSSAAWTDGKIITSVAPPSVFVVLTQGGWIVDESRQLQALQTAKQAAKDDIDAAVAAIYGRFNPFVREYALREKQAKEFIAANYEGDVPPQIKAVVEPTEMTPKQAADSIIADAQKLETALEELGKLRMQKLAVDNMSNINDINIHRDSVLQQIVTAAEQL